MARYIDADAVIGYIEGVYCEGCEDCACERGENCGIDNAVNLVDVYADENAADVVPKSEVVKILFDLKRQIHDKAVRPHSAGIDAYISLKVFDAVLQNIINKYI